jgi:hypothetical protein
MKKNILFIMLIMSALGGKAQTFISGTINGNPITVSGTNDLGTFCSGAEVCLSVNKPEAVIIFDPLLGSSCASSPVTVPCGVLAAVCCTYNIVGTYNISFTKYQYSGCAGPPTDSLIFISPSPVYTITIVDVNSSLTVSPNPACQNIPICFSDTTTTNPGGTFSTINYGDETGNVFFSGGSSCYTYPDSGTYTVCVISTFGQCADTTCIDVVVNPTVADFSADTVCKGVATTFTDLSTCFSPGSTYLWSFGGGVFSTLQNPTYVYPIAGNYNVQLTVTDLVTGLTYTVNHYVVVNPLPTFTITGSFTSCVQASSVLTPYTVVPSTLLGATYTWSTSTGLSGTGTTVNLGFYPDGGTVTFVATDTATGCTYTDSMYVGSCCLPEENPIINFTNINTTSIPTLYPGIGSPVGGAFTIVGKTLSINGTFTVNANLTLAGCKVLMGYNAKIIVDPGKTFLITTSAAPIVKSHVYACNEMWDGIYVSNSTSMVIINNGSTVEDAMNMLVSDNKGNYRIYSTPAFGNVILNKNYKTVVVKNALVGSHPGFVRSTTIQCYDGVVGGNPAITLNKLHFPHATERSFIGMEISNTNSLIIGNSIVVQKNTFDNMDFGIKSTNSSLNVHNNDFKNITIVGAVAKGVECTVGTAICATGGKTVIRTINVGSSSALPFFKNTFSNDGKGVVVTQFMNANIWKNDFNNITNLGIRLSKNATNVIVVSQNVINNTRVGIDCFDNQSANVTIDNNDIDAGVLLVASGILAQEVIAGTTVYKITRNTIRNVRYGAYGIGLKNSNISLNDVYLKHTTSPLQECYGVRLANSSLCSVVSNRVYGTNTIDYWVQGISLDLCMSDYVTCNESHTLGTGMFFGGTQTPNTFVAKNWMNNNYRGLVINTGVIGQQGVIGTPNDNRWTGTFTSGCYTEVISSNGLLSQFLVRIGGLPYKVPVINNCVPSGIAIPFSTTTGISTVVCSSLPGGGPPHKPLLLQIASDSIVPAAYDASTRWMLKQSLYQHLKVDPSTIATEPLIAQFQSDYSVNNMGKLDNVETVLSDLTTATPSTLASVQTVNNTVIPASDVEANSKWMNNMLIENALAGSDYSVSQISDLQILAAKCPYNDGQAVYQARVILSQIEDVEYLNGCETASSGSHSMSQFSQSEEPSVYNNFKLFPNPNGGTMNFIYSLKETSQGEMIIFDLTGKVVANYQLASGLDNQILINESSLSNGVYFYKVIIDSEIKVSDKIVIIK